jgi:hypothetical protein
MTKTQKTSLTLPSAFAYTALACCRMGDVGIGVFPSCKFGIASTSASAYAHLEFTHAAYWGGSRCLASVIHRRSHAEYHPWSWRKHSFIQVGIASAEIRTGGRVGSTPSSYGYTEFEMQVRELGLSQQTCADSTESRRWCERNMNRLYVAEWLLDVWAIPVDPNFGW